MNFKQKLANMLIGCLFTPAGYFLTSLGDALQSTHAQQNDKEAIDEIYYREVKIVNKVGRTVVNLHAVEDGHGFMEGYNNAGKAGVNISTANNGIGIM